MGSLTWAFFFVSSLIFNLFIAETKKNGHFGTPKIGRPEFYNRPFELIPRGIFVGCFTVFHLQKVLKNLGLF